MRRYLVILALGAGCDGGGEGDPTDSGGAVTFSDVQPIFEANCSSCHMASGSPSGHDWEGHDTLVDVPSDELPSMDRIEPGDAQASYLFLKVTGTHADAGGSGEQMPAMGAEPLDQADIDTIEQWILDGALE
jgi:mono/diheme cytochrome c family protein